MGDVANKIVAGLELRKHFYRLKEQGADLVMVDEKPFERYIDSVEVADDVIGAIGVGVKKISTCEENNVFKVIIDFSDGSRKVFVNHPAIINYRLREIKLPGKESK